MEVPPIQQAFEGFTNGAKSVDPDFPVSEVYIGSFTDISAAKEAALSLIAQGADVVVPNANAAGLGAVQAASETGPQIGTFSVYSDYSEVAPENMLGTFVADYGQGIVRIVSEVKEGSFAPDGNIEFGLKDTDVVMFSLSDDSANPVPEEVRAAVEEATSKIVSGEVQTRAR
jgi:simple sugar transport system substrate-binding protein